MVNIITKFILGFLLVLILALSANAEAPVAYDVNVTTPEDTPINITLNCTDSDINDTLTYLKVSNNECFGDIIGNMIPYTPNENFYGIDSCMYKCNDGTSDSNNATITVTVTPVNDAPTIDSFSPSSTNPTVKPNEVVIFSITASDIDGDNLTTMWYVDGSVQNETTNSFSYSNSVERDYNITAEVSDGIEIAQQQWTLTVSEARLIISDLDVEVDDDKDKNLKDGDKIGPEAKPGSVVKLNIEVKNDYDFDLEDVIVEAILRNIDKDDDDLEEESDEFDLGDGKDEKVTIEFDIPLHVEDQEYTLTIDVKGKDNDGKKYSVEWTIYLEVEKDKHNVVISGTDLNPTTVRCEDSVSLGVKVTNIGKSDEDEVVLEVRSDNLDLNFRKTEIELEENPDSDDDYSDTFTFKLPLDLEEGAYQIGVKVYYDTDKLSDSKTLTLMKEECEKIVVEQLEEVEVVTPPPSTTKPTNQPETSKEGISLEYLLFLILLTIIVLSLIIYAIGYLVIKKK